ncbi:MAG TPA: hypothetical protein VFH48_15570 [Chloroflexota bacterium]|nr:hypothetical protein [Chloroflexota bacterium]
MALALVAGVIRPDQTEALAPSEQVAPFKPSFHQVVRGVSQPVFVTHAGDGSGRLFLVEKSGRIRILVNGQPLPTEFLRIGDAGGGFEQGLLGLAFHPNAGGDPGLGREPTGPPFRTAGGVPVSVDSRAPWMEQPTWIEHASRAVVLALVLFVAVYPILAVLATSLATQQEIDANGGFMLWLTRPTLAAYQMIFSGGVVMRTLAISIGVTVVGTLVSLTLTVAMAYGLSRPRPARPAGPARPRRPSPGPARRAPNRAARPGWSHRPTCRSRGLRRTCRAVRTACARPASERFPETSSRRSRRRPARVVRSTWSRSACRPCRRRWSRTRPGSR